MISAAEIKAFAQERGFDAVGIVPAHEIREAEKAFSDWIQAGFHGQMKYLEDYRQRLARLRSAIPGAKSILVFGVNYYSGVKSQPDRDQDRPESIPLSGRIARYAWGKDYHQVIARRLREVENFIKVKVPEARCLVCVDTQPVFERSYAEKAGLGFRGRQSHLLSKDFGPWLFLSEIVTDMELTADEPRDHGSCGTCMACLEICPTGALVEPGKVDSRKCIAYLTIEHKGVIPRPIRPLMKNWVFGCDECLNICPFTRFSKESAWEELHPQSGMGRELDLISLFQIGSQREYERKFRGLALLRASRKMMLRNAAVVLGNLGDPRAVPALSDALQREAPLVRIHAAWALGRIGGREANEALETGLLSETDPEVKEEIEYALDPAHSR